jgi:hypothetical protein
MKWCAVLGVACSCALSIKWTTLATPGMIAVESTLAVFFLKSSGAALASRALCPPRRTDARSPAVPAVLQWPACVCRLFRWPHVN